MKFIDLVHWVNIFFIYKKAIGINLAPIKQSLIKLFIIIQKTLDTQFLRLVKAEFKL